MSNVIKVSGKTREQYLESMKGKGEEYLASRLFDALADIRTMRQELSRKRQEETKYYEEYVSVYKVNQNLAIVLEKNGVRPVPLRIRYTTEDCSACDYAYRDPYDYNMEWQCGNEDNPNYDCPEKTILTSATFYTYYIEDDELSGIISDFTNESYDVLEVVDERTGKTIWKKPKEKKV